MASRWKTGVSTTKSMVKAARQNLAQTSQTIKGRLKTLGKKALGERKLWLNEARLHWRGYTAMGLVFALVIFSNEVMLRGSLYQASQWMVTTPHLFFLNWGMMMVFAGLLLMVIPVLYPVTLMVALPVLWLGAVNGVKMAIRTAPLTLGDMLLVQEVMVLMPLLRELRYINDLIIGTTLVAALALLIRQWFPAGLLHKHHRLTGSLLATLLLLLTLAQPFNWADRDMWDKGFLYTLLVPPAENKAYDEAVRLAAEHRVEALLTSQEEMEASTVKPNIIVIMSESFWDVNKLGVTFTQNPIPNFEALRAESLYGEAYVPVFSGGTANTEFEILTGMTMKNYRDDWEIVYTNNIHGPLPSLASILRNQGYYTVALHPHMGWYYNRNDVFKHMGFHEFETLEFIVDLDLVGYYVSDAYVTDRLLEIVREREEPVFTFVTTMQNHGPFTNDRYEEEDFVVKVTDPLSEASTQLLSSYAQGLYLSDLALKDLVDNLRNHPEPTLLLFFGDHLATLGDDHLVYRETGFIGNETNRELVRDLRMMTVPYILWSNYDTPVGEQSVRNISFLTPQLLQLAGQQLPHYLQLVDTISQEMPVIMRKHGIGADDAYHYENAAAYQAVRAKYLLAHEMFTLARPSSDTEQWVITENPDFNLHYREIVIDTVAEEEGQTIITGNNFYREMTFLVNNEPAHHWLETGNRVISEQKLFPGDEIRFLLIDGRDNVLAASPGYLVPEGYHENLENPDEKETPNSLDKQELVDRGPGETEKKY